MRSDTRMDQAEGLRRLLLRNHTQVLTLLAGKAGVGRTCTTVNLAAALTHLGKEVLVLDENPAPKNILAHLGLYSKFDFLDVVHGKCKLREAVLKANGFSVLSTARTMNSLAQLTQSELQCLENALTEVSTGVDVILVDAAMPVLMKPMAIRQDNQDTIARSLLINQAEGWRRRNGGGAGFTCGVSLLVMMDATASGITDSYALIKRLALENTCLQFEIVVNKVSDEKAAMTVFENMAKVARCNLAARLEYLGCILRDDRLKRATQHGKPVIEAFPTATSAISYHAMAQRLLSLPMMHSETDGGVRTVIQNLMRKISQPLRQHSKKVTHVVNC